MEAFRRHIVIDNTRKIIFMEVQTSLNGEAKKNEFDDITQGRWYKHAPIELRDDFRKAVGNGYTIEPFLAWAAKNEGFYVLQMMDCIDKKPVIYGSR